MASSSPGPPTQPQPPASSRFHHITTFTPPTPSRAWLTAAHPTQPVLATAHADKTVRIYSLTSNTHLSTISGGHKRSIRTCAWKPNLPRGTGENVVATGSFDASVGIWRCWGLNPAESAAAADGEAGEQRGGRKSGGGENNEEEDDEEWRFAIVLDGHESEVKCVAWSAGGNLLATCSRDKSVWVWEEVGEDDYETVAVLQEHEGDVKCVSWHPEEELLASASYDDDVRLWREDVDDWGCVGLLKGHKGTVWCVAWEGVNVNVVGSPEGAEEAEKGWAEWKERRAASGPRLISCSDDRSIRVWRRVPSEKVQQSRLSIIKSGSSEEQWVEEARLPKVHTWSVYAVAWSKVSGLVVSVSGDGSVVVYVEKWDEAAASTKWEVVARVHAAHDVFEVNHVTWAKRRSSKKEPAAEDECVVTTGDDGTVKVWEISP